MFAAIRAIDGAAPEGLAAVARQFSPRVELTTDNRQPVVLLDLAGLDRLFGDAGTIARELRRTAAAHALDIRVAIAGTRTAARLLVGGGQGAGGRGQSAVASKNNAESVLPTAHCLLPTDDVATLAALPIESLRSVDDTVDLATIRRWGLRTLGELAALPASALAARLGQDGVRWQRLARGEDPCPLVPALPEERFEQALDLEWPIEGLEPLSFVLGRLIDPLAAHLERRGRGAAVLHVRLHLIKGADGTREVYERSLQLPVAMRDARTLRTLALLDLESHPPPAAIERVIVAVDPTPERVLQFSLLTRPLPSPEQLSTLNARLAALMGESRCGAPVAVDSWRPGAFAMKPFAPSDSHRDETPRHRDTEVKPVPEILGASVPRCSVSATSAPAVALRRFRHPVPARVRTEQGSPWRVTIDRRGFSGGGVASCAGPWRTSGNWWCAAPPHQPHPPQWDRDEWDVTLGDGATYRIFRERNTDAWFVDGVVD